MIHAEATNAAGLVAAVIDTSMPAVFEWAHRQLLSGAAKVLVWTSGPRNVPTELTLQNLAEQRAMWMEQGG